MSNIRIISSGNLGAESAALDAAIRFNIPYGGFTSRGALVPGDRPTGRYRLDERPFVHPMLLLKANIARAEGILLFSGGELPPRLESIKREAQAQRQPCLHVDFAAATPDKAAFRIAAWIQENNLASLCVSGTDLREDHSIYPSVHDTMSALFLLGSNAAPTPGETLH